MHWKRVLEAPHSSGPAKVNHGMSAPVLLELPPMVKPWLGFTSMTPQ